MVEHYKQEGTKPGCGGFIVLICNMCRFAIQLQTRETWLRQFLGCHDPWLQFQQTLLEATKQSVRKYTVWEDEDEDEDDEGIDLGSSYAKGLGFAADAPIDDTQTKKKKRKKSKKKVKSNNNNNTATNNDTSQTKEDQKFWSKTKKGLSDSMEHSVINPEQDKESQKYLKSVRGEIEKENKKAAKKKKPSENDTPIDLSFWNEITSGLDEGKK